MENSEGLREQIRAAERAAAAPYVDYRPDPWWVAPGFGLIAALLVLGIGLRSQTNAPGWASTVPMAAVVVCVLVYVRWQRRRLGTLPSGKAPREVRRVLRVYIVAGLLVGLGLFLLADLVSLWWGLPIAFAVTTGAMAWYISAYSHAAERVRERLT